MLTDSATIIVGHRRFEVVLTRDEKPMRAGWFIDGSSEDGSSEEIIGGVIDLKNGRVALDCPPGLQLSEDDALSLIEAFDALLRI